MRKLLISGLVAAALCTPIDAAQATQPDTIHHCKVLSVTTVITGPQRGQVTTVERCRGKVLVFVRSFSA